MHRPYTSSPYAVSTFPTRMGAATSSEGGVGGIVTVHQHPSSSSAQAAVDSDPLLQELQTLKQVGALACGVMHHAHARWTGFDCGLSTSPVRPCTSRLLQCPTLLGLTVAALPGTRAEPAPTGGACQERP